jgi:hypothetical protein
MDPGSVALAVGHQGFLIGLAVGEPPRWRSEVPVWARLPEREAWPWWFVTDLRGLQPQALVESPSSFRRRGVFITSGALERA